MGLYKTLPEHISEVDVVVAGGGTAGCIVAARLAEADPGLSVLVIEEGPNSVGNPLVQHPALFLGNQAPDSTTIKFHKSRAADQVAGREIVVPIGSALGGGSAVNAAMYSRAQRCDWDSWSTPGWSATDILPFLKKLETYHGPGPAKTHGYTGPIHVSGGTFRSSRLEDDFVSAMGGVGWPEIDDLNSLDSCNGVQRAVRYVSPDGRRQDASSRYLHPRLEDGAHPNLHVLVESQVVRVLVENGKAAGVVYRPKTGGEGSGSRTVRASKMVVVSCGALGTPPVLERSGIGSPEVLEQAGISEIVADLPGVGDEYDDHQWMPYPYFSSLAADETLDGILAGSMAAPDLIRSKHKILGWNAQDVTCKVRPTDEEVVSLGPEFQAMWDKEFRSASNRPLAMMALIGCYPGPPLGIPAGQYFSISTFPAYPHSTGHVHITGPDPSDPLDFSTGYLTDEQGLDIKEHRWIYKKQREVARRMQCFRGELPGGHPAFPSHSGAALVRTEGPLTDVQDLVYSVEDDALIDDFVRGHVGTLWHSLGTCKMAPRERNGVVDGELSVHGVKNLKLADLSVAPKNVAAHTNNTALVIGEKAAAIIIRQLGLGQ